MGKLVLYGFDGSTYVRTVRMVLHDKGTDYEQIPVNVLEGEPRQPEHLKHHPFGKVPVLYDGDLKLLETSAIAAYLDETLDGPTLTPDNARDRARMRMVMGIIDSYGYGALVSVAGYHLFPDFIGGQNEEARKKGIEMSRLVLTEIMKVRGSNAFIAGDKASLADYYLAPICFYVSLTPDAEAVFGVPGFADWWKRVQELECYKQTEPDLG